MMCIWFTEGYNKFWGAAEHIRANVVDLPFVIDLSRLDRERVVRLTALYGNAT